MTREISKKDFVEWTENPVTEVFFSSVRQRIQELSDGLVHTAGVDVAQDNRIVGMVQFAEKILSVDYEDVNDA